MCKSIIYRECIYALLYSYIHIYSFLSCMLLLIYIFIYVPIVHVHVLILVLFYLLLISIVLIIYAFLSSVPSMFHLIPFGMSIIRVLQTIISYDLYLSYLIRCTSMFFFIYFSFTFMFMFMFIFHFVFMFHIIFMFSWTHQYILHFLYFPCFMAITYSTSYTYKV